MRKPQTIFTIITLALLANLLAAQIALSQNTQAGEAAAPSAGTQISATAQPDTATQSTSPAQPNAAAQLSTAVQTVAATEQLNPGNFGFSRIPDGFSFPSVDIVSPGAKNSYYFASPAAAPSTASTFPANYLEVFDGRYNGGIKITVQVTPHTSAQAAAAQAISNAQSQAATTQLSPAQASSLTSIIPVTNESIIVSDFSATQETKGETPKIDTSNFYYYSQNTPDETANFHPFPKDGILVLMDAPTASGTQGADSQGRVAVFRFYPSYKLEIPDTTLAGTYTGTITYTIEDSIKQNQ